MADEGRAQRRNDPRRRLTRLPAAVPPSGPDGAPRGGRLPPRAVSWVARGEELPGTRYRLKQWLGEGALGVVYEAHHTDIERRVAFKILRADAADTPAADAFRAEARTVSTIGSPYIVEIYDVGELPDGRAWIAMELLDGEALDASVGAPVSPARVIPILRQVCKGLATAHDAGVVHRDIKPENIVLIGASDGRADAVKLVDFGIAELVGKSGEQAATGTPAYMAPEQITGASVDARLDLYALGCVAYELLSGRLPFDSPSVDELLHHHTHSSPPPLLSAVPSVPAVLAEVVMRCLAKQPQQRYADMRDLEAALCEAQVAAGITTAWDDLPLPEVGPARLEALRRAMPRPHRPTPSRWRVPALVGLVAVAVAVLVLVATGLLRSPPPTEPGVVERLAGEAKDAAARASFVYPLTDDPTEVTAFVKVLELEDLGGDEQELAQQAAESLRRDFAHTLVTLGDRYWEDPNVRPFAIDYYAQALLFEPEHARASERVLLTPGELASLRLKATERSFSPRELQASRPLVALASEDEQERDTLLQQLLEAGTRGSLADQRLACASPSASSSSLATGRRRSSGRTEAEPGPDAELGSEVTEEAEDTTGGDPEPAPTPSSRRDPAGARKLAKQGSAALAAGKGKDAETLFHRALSLDNRNAEALGGLASVYFNRGTYQRAMSFGRRAVRMAPRSGRYRIALGDALYKLFRYTEAREQYRKAKSLGHPQAKDRLAKVESRISG